MHVGLALLLGPVTPILVAALWVHGYPGAMAAIFAVLVPILFYTFLSGAWFFKLATDNVALPELSPSGSREASDSLRVLKLRAAAAHEVERAGHDYCENE